MPKILPYSSQSCIARFSHSGRGHGVLGGRSGSPLSFHSGAGSQRPGAVKGAPGFWARRSAPLTARTDAKQSREEGKTALSHSAHPLRSLNSQFGSARKGRRENTVGPNLDRLTVGVDLGDRWSQYCILGLKGETLAEGQLRTTQEDVRKFFQALTAARVVIEVGTHSAWVQDVITEWGHEVLVANPRLMEGSKRRKRKSDRIDANKLARLGRVDPQSLYPIRHRSREVRQDLVVLRARDALVSIRTELINTTRGLVKSMGTRHHQI